MQYQGLSPSDVDDMPFDVISQMWQEGKPVRGVRIDSDDHVDEIRRNWRQYVWGL